MNKPQFPPKRCGHVELDKTDERAGACHPDKLTHGCRGVIDIPEEVGKCHAIKARIWKGQLHSISLYQRDIFCNIWRSAYEFLACSCQHPCRLVQTDHLAAASLREVQGNA